MKLQAFNPYKYHKWYITMYARNGVIMFSKKMVVECFNPSYSGCCFVSIQYLIQMEPETEFQSFL